MFENFVRYMEVPSWKGCFHLMLTVLQRHFSEQELFIFLHMMRNLILKIFNFSSSSF